MKKLKKTLTKFAEYYLIVLVILGFYSPPFNINPLAIVFVLILILQIIFKNVTSGLLIAALFILSNLFMFIALLSELSEFTRFNATAMQLLLVGLVLIGFNLFVSRMMINKYLHPKDTEKHQLEAGI